MSMFFWVKTAILPCFWIGTVLGRSNGNCHIFGLQKRIINHTERIRVFFSRTIITVVFPYPIPDIFSLIDLCRQSHSDHRLNLFSLPAQSKTNIRGIPDTDIYTRIRLVHIGTHSKNTFQNYQKYTLTVFKDTLWEKSVRVLTTVGTGNTVKYHNWNNWSDFKGS